MCINTMSAMPRHYSANEAIIMIKITALLGKQDYGHVQERVVDRTVGREVKRSKTSPIKQCYQQNNDCTP